jgi:signal recognition particle subunit SRP72
VCSVGDLDLKLLVENNESATSDKPENPYLLQRTSESWLPRGKEVKLFHQQLELLIRNIYIIDLNAQKVRGVRDRTSAALSQEHHPSTRPGVSVLSVLNAAAETHNATGKELVRKMQTLVKKRPTDVGLLLTLLQVQLENGDHGQALSTLEPFLSALEQAEDAETKDARFSPGLVGLAVSLLRIFGRENAAKNELVKATKYWQTRPAGRATSLLREAGIELLRSSNNHDLLLAGSAFEKLLEEHQGSHIAAAGLVASLAPSNPAKVQHYASELPAVDELIQGVNLDDLLKSGIAAAPKSNLARKRPLPTDADRKVTKKRRTRKLPKSYEEGKTPDPERWLPLRDRSSYRPKGKKGKKKAAESTQGGIVKEEGETLELVGGGGVKVERAPAAASATKKKKKGKK